MPFIYLALWTARNQNYREQRPDCADVVRRSSGDKQDFPNVSDFSAKMRGIYGEVKAGLTILPTFVRQWTALYSGDQIFHREERHLQARCDGSGTDMRRQRDVIALQQGIV